MTAARLAARAAGLLDPETRPVLLVCAAAPRLRAALGRVLPAGAGAVGGAVVAFVGAPADPGARQRMLRDVVLRLPDGAPVLVVDHNQPRGRWRRLVGAVTLGARGLGPARARYPVARELRALGLAVDALRLAAGERIQLVLARRPAASPPG